MPQYLYACPKCGTHETKQHRMSECDRDHYCSNCDSVTLRQIETGNFVLKGDGWHRDEYTRLGRAIKG